VFVGVSSVRPPEEWIRFGVDAMPKVVLGRARGASNPWVTAGACEFGRPCHRWETLRSEADSAVLR